jgi:hypothetical protein
VQPLDLSLSLSLYLILSAIDPRSQPARGFAPVRYHLPVILLSMVQFSVPGPHQTNLLGQPRFSSRPMAEIVSAHDRIPRPRDHLNTAHPPREPSRPPGCQISAPCVPYKSCSHNPNPRLHFLCVCLPHDSMLLAPLRPLSASPRVPAASRSFPLILLYDIMAPPVISFFPLFIFCLGPIRFIFCSGPTRARGELGLPAHSTPIKGRAKTLAAA